MSMPLHLRDATNMRELAAMAEYLFSKPDGAYVDSKACVLTLPYKRAFFRFLSDVYAHCRACDKHRIMQYLNLLVKSGDVLKLSRKVGLGVASVIL